MDLTEGYHPRIPSGLLAANMGAEAWLPTPAAKKDLGDGNYEVTLKALKPLELVPHGVAEGMKHSDETTFMVCHQFDISDLEASHVTAFTPLITKQADAPDDGTVVHHIDLFLCDSAAANMYPRNGGRCDSFPDQVVPDMEWAAQGKFVTWTERLTRSCREFIYAYDRGAGTVTFPEQYGVRIGKGTPFPYVIMQRHLLMRATMPTFHEWSGVKLTLTTNLRPINLGIAGTLDYALSIPAKQASYIYNFTCPAERVAAMFAPDSDGFAIRPIALHLHMHNLGKRMWLELIRDGKVVTTIGRDDHYGGYGPSEDYHTNLGPFTDEQLIHKGDALRVHCEYDTSAIDTATTYGIDWGYEMCGPLFYYAPHDPNKFRPDAYACEGEFGHKT